MAYIFLIQCKCGKRNQARHFGRSPDCLDSHACVPGSSLADPVWGVLRKKHCFSLLNVTRR